MNDGLHQGFDRPRVICLCGPTRFREAHRRAMAELTLQGHIVHTCGVFKGDPEWGDPAKVTLDELHLRKIDLSDEVCLIGYEEQAGESTRRELAYARSKGIPISTWSVTRYPATDFQSRVQPWLMDCFGPAIAGDREEWNHRFIEEALELVQALGCTESEVRELVAYVYGRPAGDPPQEVGGVMVTLAALCLAQNLHMDQCAETELARVWTKVEQIRAKQAAKPKYSPLPEAPEARS